MDWWIGLVINHFEQSGRSVCAPIQCVGGRGLLIRSNGVEGEGQCAVYRGEGLTGDPSVFLFE